MNLYLPAQEARMTNEKLEKGYADLGNKIANGSEQLRKNPKSLR
jgi:hypothetical protein